MAAKDASVDPPIHQRWRKITEELGWQVLVLHAGAGAADASRIDK
jgi:hypothetical protein